MTARSTSSALVLGGPAHVNLMPRAAIDRRERAGLLRRWAWGLGATLLTVALLSAAAFGLQTMAAQRLSAANAHTTQLLSDLSALQPVRQKLDLQQSLSDFRSRAMAADVRWSIVLGAVAARLPAGVSIADVELSPGPVPQGDDPTTQVGVYGHIILTSTDPADIVPVIRRLRTLPGATDVDGWTQTLEEGVYRHDISVTLDQSVYTGAYEAEEG
ncbi:hypothetical protein [Microbacterium sp.]|uniref:hypothetical protein n=1 Tax=Microbacterium sp. TaxID=51671 RepID=UPI0039E5E6DB